MNKTSGERRARLLNFYVFFSLSSFRHSRCFRLKFIENSSQNREGRFILHVSLFVYFQYGKQ